MTKLGNRCSTLACLSYQVPTEVTDFLAANPSGIICDGNETSEHHYEKLLTKKVLFIEHCIMSRS